MEEITPRLTTIEDGVSRNDYTMGVLAYNIHKASKFKYFKTSELSRLAWKISRRGFKETAQNCHGFSKTIEWLSNHSSNTRSGFLFKWFTRRTHYTFRELARRIGGALNFFEDFLLPLKSSIDDISLRRS